MLLYLHSRRGEREREELSRCQRPLGWGSGVRTSDGDGVGSHHKGVAVGCLRGIMLIGGGRHPDKVVPGEPRLVPDCIGGERRDASKSKQI